MKYLTNSGLSYFLNKIKAYLTSSTYLNSIGISNSEIDDIADDAGYSSGSLPASEDVFLTGDIIPNTDNSVDLGASSKNFKMIYTKGITINGTQFVVDSTLDVTSSNAISNSAVADALTSVLPIGSYIQFAGSQAPEGFLVCNGGAISRTTYSKLFAVIGTAYGSGDGSTTFNLPNLTDRFLQGSTTSGTVKNAGLPNINGAFGLDNEMGTSTSSFFARNGAIYVTPNYSTAARIQVYAGQSGNAGISLDASRSSLIYGSSSTVQPPALTCLICIKY